MPIKYPINIGKIFYQNCVPYLYLMHCLSHYLIMGDHANVDKSERNFNKHEHSSSMIELDYYNSIHLKYMLPRNYQYLYSIRRK